MGLPSCTTAMPRIGSYTLATLLATLPVAPAAIALEDEWQNHQWGIRFRPRVAYVDADNNARAASVLLRGRLASDWTEKFSTLVEMDYVALGWKNEFSNGEHFNDKPVIPDVEGFDLNQLLLSYAATNSLQLAIGREAVNLGNERFVGSNSFWQNEQTLDMAGLTFSFGTASFISYRFVDNANRISGDDAGTRLSPSDSDFIANNGQRPARFLGDHDHHSHLLFAEFKEWDFSTLQTYYYDMEIRDAQAASNKTTGLRYEYKGRLKKLRALAHAELALQERPEVDSGNWMPYYNIGAGLGYRASELSINYEELGANNDLSFTTPLASLHDFNGWVDKFLITPTTGLRDYSLQYIWRQSPLKIDARYHFFHAANNNTRYGEELDIDFIFKTGKRSSVLLRYADFYSHDQSYQDERRIFLMFSHDL